MKEGTRYNIWNQPNKKAGLVIMAQKAGKVKLLEEKKWQTFKVQRV